MSINTILLKLDNEGDAARLVDVARDVAARLDAHVTGACVVGPDHHPAAMVGRAASAGFERMLDEAAAERAGALRRIFSAIMSGSELSWSWSTLAGELVPALAEESLYADLLIDGLSTTHDLESRLAGSEDDDLLLKCACPVLLVPESPVESVGSHIAIAWKPGREAARSVHQSVPLLRRAEQVTVISVQPDAANGEGLQPLLTYLERCGIKAETRLEIARRGEEPQRIRETVEVIGANMLVMGAYSHSRLREMLLGGVTHDILAHMAVPCFMSR